MRIKKIAAFRNGIRQELPDGGSSSDKKNEVALSFAFKTALKISSKRRN